MKIPLKWLKEFVDVQLPLTELGERLTMAGLDMADISPLGKGWPGVVLAKILKVSPHPNADRLKLVTVNTGKETPTVVSGAPNLSEGALVPFAYLGAELIDGHTGKLFKLQTATIRGVLSSGMVCSEKELGISDRHEGIMVLPADAPLGLPLGEYLGDWLLDIDITPNRPDWLCVLGIAREASALTRQPLRLPPISYPETNDPHIEDGVAVEIEDSELCPRYCAGLALGVKVSPSPAWLQERLLACGMRPINNIVDVTNYVMLEYGQPLHAFDFHTLRGRKVVVRRAGVGERLTTLDGVERGLSSEMLVIADKERAVALAGVMGGRETEVTPQTQAILLEAASFNSASIRRTSSQFKLRTEASVRFERNLSPGHTLPALRRALQLILELAGGKAAQGIIDAYPGKKEELPIPLTTREVTRLLGLKLGLTEIQGVLSSLGFAPQQLSPTRLQVRVPYWRSDIRLPADLVEEVARIVGYERIPTTLMRGELPQHQPQELTRLRERLTDILSGLGLQEVVNYSLTSEERLNQVAAPLGLRVANPISREQEYLRTSLRPGLLSCLARNQKHEPALGLFEAGRVYLPRERELPQEKEVVGCVLSGLRGQPSWLAKGEEVDFFEAKGLAEALLARLRVEAQFRPSREEGLFPSRQAALWVEGSQVGVVGEILPAIVEAFEATPPAYLLELELDQLLPYLRLRPYQPLPRLPALARDIALVVDEALPTQRVKDLLQGFPLVVRASLFDLYTGSPIPSGKKSLAFHLTFQSPHRTLTDGEVDALQQHLVAKLKTELGATLRG